MERLKEYKSLIQFYSVLNLAILLFITLSSYVHIPLIELKDYFSYGVHLLLMQFSLFGAIYILTLNRWFFYGLCLPLFLLLAIIGFFGFTQDISLSAGVIQASIETKSDVVADLVSWQLIVYIIFILGIIFLLIKLYQRIDQPKLNWFLVGISILSFITFWIIESKRGGTLKNRLPYTLFFETKKFLSKDKITFQPVNQNLTHQIKDLQIIFILGESVRADHLQINGYERETNPLLNQETNLISFPKTFTTHTYTGASVPQILSNASIYDDYEKPIISLIDVLNQAQIPTIWIGNQTPEKSYLSFIENSTQRIFVDPTHSEFSFSKALDETMLPEFQKELKPNQSQFMLIHMMGSHWYYENRYPKEFQKFKPVIQSKYIPSNSAESMINSYDNTLVYLDYFIYKIIQTLKKENSNAILIYVSDHGELLGEEGKWLHAQLGNTNAVREPAVFVWYSDQFEQKFPEKINSMKSNQQKLIPLDFVFHSVLDLYEIDFEAKNNKLSIFDDFDFENHNNPQ